jgi:hypothetical protein
MTDIQLITLARVYEMQPGTNIKTRNGRIVEFQSWSHRLNNPGILCHVYDGNTQDVMGEFVILRSTEDLSAECCAYCGMWHKADEMVKAKTGDRYYCDAECRDCADMSRD